LAVGVDAFTYKWESGFYAFPPFNLILRVLNKIKLDKVEGIVIVPFWTTQPWFPLYNKMTKSNMLFLGPNSDLLFNPYSRDSHQVHKNLQLMACVLTGSPN